MLYEMVVGQVPFNADTPFSVIHDHIYTPLPMPHKVNPQVPESVERVLLKALAKERDDRYEDVSVLVEAFKDAWEEAGVPMQGTFVRLSQALKPVAPRMPVSESPTKAAVSLPSTVVTAEPKVSAAKKTVVGEAVSNPDKMRSTSIWLWVSAGLVIILCLGFLAVARNNRLFARLLGGANKTPIAATQQVQVPPELQQPQNTPQPQPQPVVTTIGGVIVPPPILDAQKRVKDNPNDLTAHLDLALAYWNAGWQKETYETITVIIKLAGIDNRDYFIRAGDKFKSQPEGWLPAASLYFQAVRSYALSGSVPNPLTESFHESLYKGSNRPDTPLVTPFERVSQVDEAIALIARSRNAFYTGKTDQAFGLLEDAKRLEPTMREAFLLEGELAAKQGNKDRAKLVLTPLIEDTASTPEWIRLFAQQILDGIK
jgi:hypothetical protein